MSREESLLVPEPGPGVTEAGGCHDVFSGFLGKEIRNMSRCTGHARSWGNIH